MSVIITKKAYTDLLLIKRSIAANNPATEFQRTILQDTRNHGIATLMKPSTSLSRNRAAILNVTKRFRVANPRVFGSVLHRTDRDGSDLDILVDVLPGATLFDLGGLQDELQELLGVPVDVLTAADLPLKFREEVLLGAEPV